MRNLLYLILLGAALLTLALVVRSGLFLSKHPGEPINSAMRYALSEQSPQLSAEDARAIDLRFPTAYATQSGLRWVGRAPGTGSSHPHPGDEVTANYDGRLLDGTPFDSSYKRGVPFQFKVGTGQVIGGWDEAFLSMKKGERRTLIVPYWLAYGEQGHPPTIPPRSTLVFDVELIDFR
jgi:FKBP-type peptidyl-prolyl cis-trans isomerase